MARLKEVLSGLAHRASQNHEPCVRAVEVSAYTIPTEDHEADGTIAWDDTTMVLVRLEAGPESGIGYSYTHQAAAALVETKLAHEVIGLRAFDVARAHTKMVVAVRNLGRPGLASAAISAVDMALWDLKARLLGVSMLDLLGRSRDRIPVYGSGGFTPYSEERLAAQLGEWASAGIRMVKMKVGSEPERDPMRVAAARAAIGESTELFVDANGAYQHREAIRFSHCFADLGVTWFEEPVSSDDLEGLRFIREHGAPRIAVTAGEYGYDVQYFRRMLQAESVDVLQADATRCLGVTGFLQAAALCDAFMVPLSAHTAPALHATLCCASSRAVHVEYFHDHVRIERLFFEGIPRLADGDLVVDRSLRGFGLTLRTADAERFLVSRARVEAPPLAHRTPFAEHDVQSPRRRGTPMTNSARHITRREFTGRSEDPHMAPPCGPPRVFFKNKKSFRPSALPVQSILNASRRSCRRAGGRA